jgi:CDP-paratose 2-epimerase
MKMKKVLITGSAGLIGAEATKFFSGNDFKVYGIDNDMRKYFFGENASTRESLNNLLRTVINYEHHDFDIRDNGKITNLFKNNKFDTIIHTAAQPSHDWAAKEPLTDFGINVTATMQLLEACRNYCPDANFIFTSTNKVYGDSPNNLPLIETNSRFELPSDHISFEGIDETHSIDQSMHSVFGASKVGADVMVQEYGRYFGINTVVFRGGCLTGPNHAGAEMHGFLSYLAKCIRNGDGYNIFGYKGKQVRDNIHSMDLVQMFWSYCQNPRPGEVYNAGGGRYSNISMLEAIKRIEIYFGKNANVTYVDLPRPGDHKWYISDTSKFRTHYPDWKQYYDIERVINAVCKSYD